MRTYNRNQLSENSYVTKINDLCRLCMNLDTTMYDIFDGTQYLMTASLASKILSCLSIEVKNDSRFPTKVCDNCFRSLDAISEFREKCSLINEQLHKLIEKSADSPFTLEPSLPSSSAQSCIDIDVCHDNELSSKEFTEKRTPFSSVSDFSSSYNFRTDNTQEINELDQEATQGEVSVCTSHQSNENELNAADSRLELEEVSDSDDCGDTVQVHVSMNGDSYVIEVLDQTNGEMVASETNCSNNAVSETLLVATNTAEVTASVDKTTYECSYCKEVFDEDSQLQNHMLRHNGPKDLFCKICCKGFIVKSEFLRHERTHSGDKPFKCDQCGRSFSQKEILRRHTLTHSADKPFKCQSCSKSYTQKEALKKHVKNNHVPRKITDINQYQCSLCDKSFCHLSGLSRHQQTHAGIKYPCKSCNRIFTDQSCLRRHTQRLHLLEKSCSDKIKQVTSV